MGLLDGLFETVVSVACLPISIVADVIPHEDDKCLTAMNLEIIGKSLDKISK